LLQRKKVCDIRQRSNGPGQIDRFRKQAEQLGRITNGGVIFDATILMEDFAAPLGGEGTDYLRRINDSAGRMDELINDLLDYSRVGPLPLVVANNPTVLHVVTNLLTNALKFIQPGVRPEIKIFAEHRGAVVRVIVQDNGIGIAEEHRERIFRIFERLHDSATYPGTGVGLAIVRKAIERLGGASGVESEPGKESSFWFELNAAP
jgi:signal transduction histidine kinase